MRQENQRLKLTLPDAARAASQPKRQRARTVASIQPTNRNDAFMIAWSYTHPATDQGVFPGLRSTIEVAKKRGTAVSKARTNRPGSRSTDHRTNIKIAYSTTAFAPAIRFKRKK